MTEIPVEQSGPVPNALALGTPRVCKPEFQMSKAQFRRKSGRTAAGDAAAEAEEKTFAGAASVKITVATGGRTN